MPGNSVQYYGKRGLASNNICEEHPVDDLAWLMRMQPLLLRFIYYSATAGLNALVVYLPSSNVDDLRGLSQPMSILRYCNGAVSRSLLNLPQYHVHIYACGFHLDGLRRR